MYLYLRRVYKIYPFDIPPPTFLKTNSDYLGKQKFWYATIVAIFWDNSSKILRPNLPEELNREHFGKINIKNVMTYNNLPNYIANVKLRSREFQIAGPNFAKRKNDKNFKK